MYIRPWSMALLIAFFVCLAFGASPAAASSPSAAVCVGVGLQGFCGDGLCDPYLGENTTSCPVDCVPPTSVPPTSVPIPTFTPTLIPPTVPLPTRAPTLRPTAAPPTSPPVTLLPQPPPTARPTAVPPTEAPTPTSVPGAGCGFVAYETMIPIWRDAYRDLAPPKYRVPSRTDNQEVFVCDVPPQGRLCFPIYDGILNAAGGDEGRIRLVQCTAEGECVVFDEMPGELVLDQFCFDIGPENNVSCKTGCALLLRPSGGTLLPKLPPITSPFVYIPLIVMAILLIAALLLLLLMVSRRDRDKEEEDEEA